MLSYVVVYDDMSVLAVISGMSGPSACSGSSPASASATVHACRVVDGGRHGDHRSVLTVTQIRDLASRVIIGVKSPLSGRL